MNCKCCFAIAGVAAISASIALAQTTKEKHPASPPSAPPSTTKAPTDKAPPADMPLPPGWTKEDMQACEEAGTPGPMHAYLAEGVGVWRGDTTIWMAPGVEPVKSTCTTTIESMMDGRFFKCETEGDMMGMPFNGFGLYGYDNVGQKFQSTWIDNCGTGMAQGTGDLSSDQTTLTWKYTYNCPITKKPTTLREIERRVNKNKTTFEIYGVDPKSGKEFKMMEIAYTRQPNGTKTATGGER